MARKPQGPVTGQIGELNVGPQEKQGISKPAPEPSPETSQTSPDAPEGQTQPDETTSPPESVPEKSAPAEESFFDPKDLPEELVPAYKSMQSAFTKRMTGLSKEREKVQAYDAFMANPEASLKQAAEQYGMRVVPINQATAPQTDASAEAFGQNWQPQTWDEVFQAFSGRLNQDLQKTFGPVFSNLKDLTTSNIERQLTEIDTNWKVYEDEMTENLKTHPTLAKDVAKLYRISVPEEVLRSKYTQAALKKFETKAASAKIQGKSSVQTATTSGIKEVKSFDDAVQYAKKELGMT